MEDLQIGGHLFPLESSAVVQENLESSSFYMLRNSLKIVQRLALTIENMAALYPLLVHPALEDRDDLTSLLLAYEQGRICVVFSKKNFDFLVHHQRTV
ncbi:MAG: hypothetical protein ACN4GW_01530 [Desulforhopalus sp.]